jgi:hypothetical protein
LIEKRDVGDGDPRRAVPLGDARTRPERDRVTVVGGVQIAAVDDEIVDAETAVPEPEA